MSLHALWISCYRNQRTQYLLYHKHSKYILNHKEPPKMPPKLIYCRLWIERCIWCTHSPVYLHRSWDKQVDPSRVRKSMTTAYCLGTYVCVQRRDPSTWLRRVCQGFYLGSRNTMPDHFTVKMSVHALSGWCHDRFSSCASSCTVAKATANVPSLWSTLG